MVGIRKPRVVVTIHGIRTYGKWQKAITPFLASHGLVPYHIDFGYFRILKFLFPFTRNRQVKVIQTELRTLLDKVRPRRVSIVAHSFGTFLALEALRRDNGAVQYDRVVLTGSILPCDFDWKSMMSKKWVMAVLNARATEDRVVEMARIASSWPLKWITRLAAGNSGRIEFSQKLPTVLDDYLIGGHSETHNPLRFERWARFIAYPLLPEDILEKITTEMQALRQQAALILSHPVDRVRVNLFAPMDGSLRIVPGATDNMNYAPEFDLEIQEDHGATGKAYRTGRYGIVLKRGAHWSGNTLPSDELEKINPALKWVISLPVKSEARHTVVGVVNIDGLDDIPAILDDVDSEGCQAAVMALYGGMLKRFQPCLEAAFRGEQLPQIES